MTAPSSVRLGTRASPLALVQTRIVELLLRSAHPALHVEVVHISTLGDAITDRPLAALGERAVFVTAIEDALRDGRIDLAVHSAKDLPSRLPDDMMVATWLKRADPRDALVSRGPALHDLEPGAIIGTSSPRRTCQVRALRSDIVARDIRGNVGTRIDKLLNGEFDAVILAMAGLDRLGVVATSTLAIHPFANEIMIPAAAQGALAIETLSSATALHALLQPIGHASTAIAVNAEREFLALVGGGCHAVVGALASVDGNRLNFAAMVGAVDGRQLRATHGGRVDDALAIARTAADELLERGGRELLATSLGA